MDRNDKLIFGILLGAPVPVFFFLLLLTFWYFQFQNYNVLYFVLTGLFTGLIIDFIFLKTLVRRVFELPTVFLILLYLFYNLCIYGFFMGFPVFNLLMGIVAGYYFGRKIVYTKIPRHQIGEIKNNISLFTGIVMLLICFSTGFIALSEETLGEELQNMFGLRFEVTKSMIILIIIIGGISLIISQYYLTKYIIIKTIKSNNKTDIDA